MSETPKELSGHAPYAFRFVVCVDVCLKDEMDGTEDAKADLIEAYSRLYLALGEVDRASGGQIEWESSDEAYAPDGQPLIEEALQEARMTVIAGLEPRQDFESNYALANIGFNVATWDLHWDHKTIHQAVEDFMWARSKVDHMREVARREGWDIDQLADHELKHREAAAYEAADRDQEG
jgi:hypothetical protein